MLEPLRPRHHSLGFEQETNSREFSSHGFPLGQPVDQNGNGRSSQTKKEERI